MSTRRRANPPDLEAERAFRLLSDQLVEAVGSAVGPWVAECIRSRLPTADPSAKELTEAARRATAVVAAELGELLERDIDQQATTPLSILRDRPVQEATEVLLRCGVPPVERDARAVSLHPADVYDLTPGGFADFGDEVGQAGLLWGAAKAHLHLRRRSGSRPVEKRRG